MKKLLITIFAIVIGILIYSCVPKSYVFQKEGIVPKFQLATPNLEFQNILIEKEEKVKLYLGIDGVEIYYTTDGSIPNRASSRYTVPISLTKSCEFKAIAFHSQYLPSDVLSQRFIKIQKQLHAKNVSISPSSTTSYPGQAADLIDLKKGSLNFREDVWMAFKSDATLTIELEEPTTIQKVTVSSISDAGSWIMPPSGIKIETSADGVAYSVVSEKNIPILKEYESAHLVFPSVEWSAPLTTQFLRISILSTGKLPEWHSGKGTASWLFLDEILFE